MSSDRRVSIAYFVVALIGTLAMIVALVELRAKWVTVRQQRAVAHLIKAGASVLRLTDDDGTKYYSVHLNSCESCDDNDELLRYVADIENVGALNLASAPLHEAGMKSLYRLKGLATLGVCVGDSAVSRETYAELQREMRLRNPNIFIGAGDKDGEPLEQ